jgi:hypothetical protein
VRAQVHNQVGVQVGFQVSDQVYDQVGNRVHVQAYKACYGSQDANWLALFGYLSTVGRLNFYPKVLPLFRLAVQAGWWWPFDGVCVVTPRPSRLVLSGDRLAEIEYPDGWGITR